VYIPQVRRTVLRRLLVSTGSVVHMATWLNLAFCAIGNTYHAVYWLGMWCNYLAYIAIAWLDKSLQKSQSM